jgi:hypothetical protein
MMSRIPGPAERQFFDRFYSESGLRAMASPHAHYDDPACPHPSCSHQMEWIDFDLELGREPEAIDGALIRAWWEGRGFVGRCPSCRNGIRFTTLGMEAIAEDRADEYPQLTENWHAVAQLG